VRITASEHAADALLLPRLMELPPTYPDVHVEINISYQMIDIVERSASMSACAWMNPCKGHDRCTYRHLRAHGCCENTRLFRAPPGMHLCAGRPVGR
jgi:DNA-binding transcriptional LysR family regulator